MPIHRTHAAAAAQTGVPHHAVKHQILVAKQNQLGIPEVWYLTAWWKPHVYHGTCSIPLIWLVFDNRPFGMKLEKSPLSVVGSETLKL